MAADCPPGISNVTMPERSRPFRELTTRHRTARETRRKPVGQRENTGLDGFDSNLQDQIEGLFEHRQRGEVEHPGLEAAGFVRKLQAVVEHPADILPLGDAAPAKLRGPEVSKSAFRCVDQADAGRPHQPLVSMGGHQIDPGAFNIEVHRPGGLDAVDHEKYAPGAAELSQLLERGPEPGGERHG